MPHYRPNRGRIDGESSSRQVGARCDHGYGRRTSTDHEPYAGNRSPRTLAVSPQPEDNTVQLAKIRFLGRADGRLTRERSQIARQSLNGLVISSLVKVPGHNREQKSPHGGVPVRAFLESVNLVTSASLDRSKLAGTKGLQKLDVRRCSSSASSYARNREDRTDDDLAGRTNNQL